ADGDDTLLGGDGHDEFDPGAGNDSVVGGGDSEVLHHYSSGYEEKRGRIIRLDRQLVEEDGSGGVGHLAGVEAATVDGNTDDVIYGDSKNNTLWGGEGADFIYGGGGDDRLQ